MKRHFIASALLISSLLLASCSSTVCLQNREGSTVKTSENGIQYQECENEDFIVTAEASSAENSQAALILRIQNKTGSPLYVSEENIRIYSGNADKNDWEYLGHWSYSRYLDEADSISRSRSTAPVGSILFLSWLLNDSNDISLFPALFTTAAVLSLLSDSPDPVSIDRDFLVSNLFRSSSAAPGGAVKGIIFFPVGKARDYRVDITAGNRTESLYFSRSGR